jgi:hypothetical protein
MSAAMAADVEAVQHGYTIPLVDLAEQTQRQFTVDREPGQYLGHPTTVLLEDGKTMIAVYPKGHGRGAIVIKRSSDGGRTWSQRLPTPASWVTSKEVPTIYRVVDAKGTKRLILFSGLFPIRMSVSKDDGRNWTELKPIGPFGGIVAMGSVISLRTGPGHYLALFHDDGRFIGPDPAKNPKGFRVYKTLSSDGGLTWGLPEVVAMHPQAHLCEPGAIRSPDGKQIAVLLRENSRRLNSFAIFSDDEGKTWSEPRELPGALTGDRHTARYAPDGRLFITFRDTTLQSPTKGDWVGWVGTYDDIARGCQGQYRVRLMKNHKVGDCAYPGLELLPDGTFVTTTYGHWTEGEPPYIVSVRFTMKELDAQARFVVEPALFIKHTAERHFIGPGAIRLASGEILMAAAWGRPPTNFDQLAAKYPVPMLYRSADGGRTWREDGPMQMPWRLTGMISDGGISFLRLQDGRLALLAHRHVKGLHGGGVPVFSTSTDDGKTWAPAQLLDHQDDVYYVMNDRMIQTAGRRLVVPVSCADKSLGKRYYEGARSVSRCYLSDDVGKTWRLSRGQAILQDDTRGMAEPCVAEVAGGRLLMLARTGQGCVYRAWSEDGGETWTQTEPTTLVSACSSLTLKMLPDRRLIVFYNHAKPLGLGAFFPRTPLVYAVSSDHGETWSSPTVVDDDGVEKKDRQNIYPAICFTPEGMLVIYSTHAADPKGSFSNGGPEGWRIGGGKRCILGYPD